LQQRKTIAAKAFSLLLFTETAHSRAVLQSMWSFEYRARWLFLAEKATQQQWFPSIATGEPL
jgi:hypothetical protein